MYTKAPVLMLFVSVLVSVVLTSCLSILDRATLSDLQFVTIVKESSANVDIIIPLKATDSEVAAASDLEKYLEEITGANIGRIREHAAPADDPIAPFPRKIPIYVGNCTASQHLKDAVSGLVNDGYVIEVGKKSLHLLGKNGLATRFAVYGFLEDHIGVHWFLPEVFGKCCFPENMGTYIPEKDTIILRTGLDVQDPDFKYRKIGEPDNLWTIRNRMNFIKGTEDDDHGYRINNNIHSFYRFLNPDMESVHSDFFAMVDGERRDVSVLQSLSDDQKKRLKLNVIEPNVRSFMAEKILSYIRDHHRGDIINIFPNDGRGFDESPESIELDGAILEDYNYTVHDVNDKGRWLEEEYGRVLSKRYTVFYHDVTNAVLSERPDKLLMTGAYSPYQYAPLEVYELHNPCESDESDNNNPCHEEFISENRMDDNVMLLITHSWEHNHPIEDRSTTPNQYFDDSIEGWKKLYSQLGVYEHYRKFAMNELPFPIIHSIRRDIPYYHRNDFSYFYTQYSLDDIGTYALNYYIAAKLLWNVNADVDRILGEFYDKFCGPAGEHMKNYSETLEQAAIDSDLELSPNCYGAFLDLFIDGVLEELDGHLLAAEAMVAGDKLMEARVHLFRVSLNYTRDVMEYLEMMRDTVQSKAFWEIQGKPTEPDIVNTISEIEEFIEDVSACKTITKSNYTDRLFFKEPSGISTSARRHYCHYYGDSDEYYTKQTWLEQNGIPVDPGYEPHENFDIWIYANNVNYDSNTGAEHQINLVTSSGGVEELGRIAGCGPRGNCTNKSGNNGKQGFLLKGFSFAEILDRDDQVVTLEVLNYPEGSRNSKFFGFAIMPHDEGTTQEVVTEHYDTNINFVREHSLGFTEFANGQQNEDRRTLGVAIPLYH